MASRDENIKTIGVRVAAFVRDHFPDEAIMTIHEIVCSGGTVDKDTSRPPNILEDKRYYERASDDEIKITW
jgi:hypothetical protein